MFGIDLVEKVRRRKLWLAVRSRWVVKGRREYWWCLGEIDESGGDWRRKEVIIVVTLRLITDLI